MTKKPDKTAAFKAAFPYTIPILAGFMFLGISYGIYMRVSGFEPWFIVLMSIIVFGGSMQFVAVSMLLSPFAPWQIFAVSLMIQARHIFYGISMLERFRGMGWKKIYLIFGMCDETFSINCSTEPPPEIDRGWFMFFVTLLDHAYWVLGSLAGGLLGGLIDFNTYGLEWVMTSMFTVIFLEQWLKEKGHISSLVGLGATVLCLLCFGSDGFLIPTMIVILILLTAFRKPIERQVEE